MQELSVSESTLKALKQLGLTEYEVQAYVALVDGGQMVASEISTRSGVPFSRIYDVLGRLEEKGFIQIQRGRPTLYTAKAPNEVVRLVQLDWEEKLDKASKVVCEDLQPRFEQETPATTRDVWLLHGRAALLAKAIEMLQTAREEVILSVPTLEVEEMLSSDEDIKVMMEAVLSLKVPQVNILTSKVSQDYKSLIPKNFEVRTRDRVFGMGIVTDKRQTLIMLAGGADSELLGVFSSHAVFAAMASAYFESLWTDSEPL